MKLFNKQKNPQKIILPLSIRKYKIIRALGYMRLIIFIISFAGIINSTFAQKVKINGTAADFKSEIVKLQIQADPISGRYITLAKDSIKSDGSFLLKTDVDEIKLARIKIGIVQLTIFLELLLLPGGLHLQ